MSQQFDNQPKASTRQVFDCHSFGFSERHQVITSARVQAAETLARLYSDLNPDEGLHPGWREFPIDPRVLVMGAFKSAHEDAPEGFIAPPLSFLSLEEGPYDLDFLRSVIENPYAHLDEVFERYPSPREACFMAAVLLRGKSMARLIAFNLLAKVCCSDTQPFSAEACLFSSIVFSLAQSIGTEEDKRFVLELQATLAVASSPTWESLFLHSIDSFPKTVGSLEDRRELIEKFLYFNDPRPFCWALRQALSKDCDPALSQTILARLIERPLPGTPALTGLLSRIVQTDDVTRRSDYMRLLSNISGFTGDYWGQLAPWTFERPLRILDQYKVDPVDLRLAVSPNIRLSTFLAACNLADCGIDQIAALDRGFQKRPTQSDESNEWLSERLRQSLYRAAFLTPREHVRALDDLTSVDLAQPEQLLQFSHSLSRASVNQRRNFPHIATLRLITSREPGAELPWCIAEAVFSPLDDSATDHAEELAEAEDRMHGSDGQDSDVLSEEKGAPGGPHLLAVLRVNPVAPAIFQVDQLREEASGATEWLGDNSFQYNVLGLAITQAHELLSASNDEVTPVQEFIRAQTVSAPIPGLLDVLGEALAHYHPGDGRVFASWRYDYSHPVVARQLRSLSEAGRTLWSTDLSASIVAEPVGTALPQEHLGGATQYQLFFTHHPQVLMRIGAIPTFTAACTSYNNAAYYSKALISFLVDAHTKALVALDTHKLLHEVAPRLPGEFTEALQSNTLSDDIFSKYCNEIMTAAEVRTVVKLVETPEGKPVVLMQPSFVRGSFKKMHNSPESARFAKTIADQIGAGLATRSYVNQKSWPLKTFILPPSRSPGGQLENHDFAVWLSGHHGATAISGSLLQPPP